MHQPGRILHFGGGTEATVVIDVTGARPVVSVGAPLAAPRRWVTGTLLPDGRVLVAGGGAPGPLTDTNAELYLPDYLGTGTP